MSIPVGTVCYLISPHSMAGQCCTVVGPLIHQVTFWRSRGIARYECMAHNIELASGDKGPNGEGWAAEPCNLIPIAPPGLTKDEDKREPTHV